MIAEPTMRLAARGRRAARGLLLGLGGLVAGQAAMAIPAEEFLASAPAQAFKAGRYAEALAGFERLLETHPDDTTVLRYIGLSRYRLGDYRGALEVYSRALEVDSDNVAALFFMGPALLQLGDREGAVAAFRRVLGLAPDSEYGRRARRYLEGLGQAESERRREPEGRRWTLFVQAGVQYDDNVAAAPDGDPAKDGAVRVFESLSAGYRLLERGPWRLRAHGSTYLSQHLEADVDEFDLQSYDGSLQARRVARVGERPLALSLRYTFGADLLEGELFSLSHGLRTEVTAGLTGHTTTELFHELTFDAFEEDGFAPSFSSRDAVLNAAGAKHYWFFAERRHYVWGGYRFEYNEAEGRNFDYRAHQGSVGGSATLPWELRLDLSGTYRHEDYPDFAGPEERETDRFAYSVAVSRPLWRGLTLSVSYKYIDERSTISALEFDRQIVTAVMGYRF